ncbi:MAG: hypothetical protein PF542_03665 [Nanoarchaeota archaeon]|jgi:hypothetical protein|nr:hypothetical protein [Nanoarchaeota archaeon]
MRGRIIGLDECVIDALELLKKTSTKNPKINFKKALVVGSENAAVTGKIIFSNKNYIFADESNYLEKLKGEKLDGCIIISASGKKHAPIIAKEMKKRKIKTILFTNTENSEAGKITNETFIFPSTPEPYTYNTSTYLGMILAYTKEKPAEILKFLKKAKVPSIKKYDSFYIILPEKFEKMKKMFSTKFDELFGPMIKGRVFTYEQTKHAKTVIESDKELFIGLGVDNKMFGTKQLNFDFPKKGDFGTILCLGYYIIGKIQKQNHPWFKESIERYLKKLPKIFEKK